MDLCRSSPLGVHGKIVNTFFYYFCEPSLQGVIDENADIEKIVIFFSYQMTHERLLQ